MAKHKCPTCGKQANFGFAKSDKQLWCKMHSDAGMIDVNSKRCAEAGCTRYPVCGMQEGKRSHCTQHALHGMKNLVSQICRYDKCPVTASYALIGKRPIYCQEHALPDMINVKSKQCQSKDCIIQPVYGFRGKQATHCKEHAMKGMVNVHGNRCIYNGCIKQPSYNVPNEKALYCVAHASPAMIDVISKRCKFKDCTIGATYGMVGSVASYCQGHAKQGMVNVRSKKCKEDGCILQPSFAKPNEPAIFCSIHALSGMIDVVSKRCELCQMTLMNRKYKPNCAQCHFYLHPDDPRIRNYKTKESAIMAEIQKAYPDIVLDSRVAGGCSRRRPDGYIDLLSHVIIVEVDENEHRSYDDTCNNRRTMELYEDFGSRNLVFVRINPDGYTRDGKRMSGAFSVSKADGMLKCNSKELAKRCAEAINTIGAHVKTIPTRAITVEYLYFSDE